MKQVELVNRSVLEQRLENIGMMEATEKVIERMKEHVHSMVVHLHEVFLVDVRFIRDDLLETILVAFTTTEPDDPPDDEGIEEPVHVVFYPWSMRDSECHENHQSTLSGFRISSRHSFAGVCKRFI